MKTVKIISGKYGHRPNGSKSVRIVYAGELVDLPDDQAERLVKLGVGAIVEAETPSPQPTEATDGPAPSEGSYDIPEAESPAEGPLDAGEANDAEETLPDADELAAMTNAQLRELAVYWGVDVTGLRTKAQLIDAILSSDGDTLPKMDAEEPVT
ncbi:MAG: hypothetical protein LUD25_02490 [Coriobacteriaceae bacterium]|nr:hypothetical protein [Coriobacteriaceae bacterium]